MAHYAVLDNNNIVTGVLTGKDEDDLSLLPEGYENWEDYISKKFCNNAKVVRTSYNTMHNTHILGGTPFRGNFASMGDYYDEINDVFYPVKPLDKNSWVLDTNIWDWKPPIDYPSDYNNDNYYWDEAAYQADNTQGWSTS